MKTIDELAAELATTERVIVSYAAGLRRAHGDTAVVADRRLVQPDGPERPSTEYIVVTLTDEATQAIRTAWHNGERHAVITSEDGNDA